MENYITPKIRYDNFSIGIFIPCSLLILASDLLTTVKDRPVFHVWHHKREVFHVWRHWWRHNCNFQVTSYIIYTMVFFAFFRCRLFDVDMYATFNIYIVNFLLRLSRCRCCQCHKCSYIDVFMWVHGVLQTYWGLSYWQSFFKDWGWDRNTWIHAC